MNFRFPVFVSSLPVALALLAPHAAVAENWTGAPMLAELEASGALPAVAERLPETPMTVAIDSPQTVGQYGGDMRMLMGKAKDIRQMTIYGYARLIGFDKQQKPRADILESFEVKDGSTFTFKLRKGHKWSDGQPFTSEDFRYFWEEIILNEDLVEGRMASALMVDGELPGFEVIDEHTVRYTWQNPNPYFIPAIAGPSPLYLYKPAHYLKQFHQNYMDDAALQKMVADSGKRNWMAVHHGQDRPYKQTNPELPTLQPWRNTTASPSERFVFERNPYFHRVDSEGKQLPYIDRVLIAIASNKLIPAKAGAGETDLQARYLRLDNFPFLKKGEKNHDYKTSLWSTAKGSQLALYPNFNTNNEQWRELIRDVNFRRALSIGINRKRINQVVYFGLAKPSNNTVIAKSSLYKADYATNWAQFNIAGANKLLDDLGLVKKDSRGIRLFPDGTPLELPVQTAGESTEQTDVLELIHDNWQQLGIKLFSVPSQRDVFRSRVFSGEAIMAIWGGLENGMPSADTIPEWMAPTSKYQYQWPKWGEYIATNGSAGEQPDIAEVNRLIELHDEWRVAASGSGEREKIWHEMLQIHSDQLFTIGLVNDVKQPVVINEHLNNVPEEAVFDISVSAYFGVYHPDTFWFAKDRQ